MFLSEDHKSVNAKPFKSDWLHTNSKLVSIGALECNIRANRSCHNSFVAVTTTLEEKTEILIAEGCQVL